MHAEQIYMALDGYETARTSPENVEDVLRAIGRLSASKPAAPWIAHWAGSSPYKGWSIRQGRDEVIWFGETVSSETVEGIVLAHNKCFDCEGTGCVMNCSGLLPAAPSADTQDERGALSGMERAFSSSAMSRRDELELPGATVYIDRFVDALGLLCRSKPSKAMCEQWLNGESEELQAWAVSNARIYWQMGIGTIEAAQHLADNPEEGEGHEGFTADYEARAASISANVAPAATVQAGEAVRVTPAEHETAVATLRHVIEFLRTTGSYTDEEGGATDYLEPLLYTAPQSSQPVAWANKVDIERLRAGTLTIAGAGAKQSSDDVPLYTAPQPASDADTK